MEIVDFILTVNGFIHDFAEHQVLFLIVLSLYDIRVELGVEWQDGVVEGDVVG